MLIVCVKEARPMDYRFDHFIRQQLTDDLAFGAGKEPGRPLPDFDLPTVTGGRVRRADFVGRRPVLFTFGCLTDPMTASSDPVLKRLHRDFGDSVAFITVYVREAHPGEHVPQPETFDRKLHHARMLRERDGIPWTVAVDELDGGFHRALGANSNSAHLVDPSGQVAFRTLWSNDERALRGALEAILAGGPDHPFARDRRVVPMARGLARMDEVVRAAGPSALEDLRRETPLVYAAAEVAWLWRTLTPLGRLTLAAAGAAAAAAIYGGVKLLARPARAR
jgi:Iodothyronine deiodinase